jgi:hypothetical protein
VPLSTSNSSERRPTKNWLRIFIFTIIFSSLMLVIWHKFNISHELWKIGTNDSQSLWAEKRVAARHLGNEGKILVGASRIQLGVDVVRMEALTGKNVVQLAVDGNPYISILEGLISDESISGTIVVSSTVLGLMEDENLKNRAHQYLSYYESKINASFSFATIEAVLSSQFNIWMPRFSNFVTPYKYFLWSKERLKGAGYLKFNSDRSVDANYSLIDEAFIYAKRIKRHMGDSQDISIRKIRSFNERIVYINELVSRFEERGGRVIFVRFPTSKRIWEIDEGRYPKEVYWDVFAELSIAKAVHFKDYESLSGFDLPDGSHLDQRDKVKFTENLVDVIF